jgi:uncharacterized repeat protein (TIGR03806 family)
MHGCGGSSSHDSDADQPAPDTEPPAAPTELTVQAASSSSVDLTWKTARDNVAVVAYRVYRSDAASFVASVTSTTYADTGLNANTAYDYSVRAVDAAGNESPASNTASATTLAMAMVGLDSRPANATCVAWARPTAQDSISLSRFTSLTFSSPIAMLQAPNDNQHWYVVEQGGVVRRFDASAPASTSEMINLTSRVRSGGEMGLLGMAFHPGFPTDNRVFLSYTTGTSPLTSRVSSFRSPDNGATLDPASETVLLTLTQPEKIHNGGNIAFGKDGFLYIGFGDGGGGGDAHGNPGNGQRLTTLLAKMLRIDVDGAAPYAIPSGNPFAQNATCPAAGRSSGECPEIFAWGFRNPWRWSFDRNTGALWVADVGQSAWEEVDQVTLGGNYGWRCREGAHDYNSSGTTGCDRGSFIEPVAEYGHDLGVSITGGYVYRGSQDTALAGKFIFGDFGSGRIWAWVPEAAVAPRKPTLLLESGLSISAFGQGNDGELYVVNYAGTLHRIDFQRGAASGSIPTHLSATGCVDPADPMKPAPGLIPYTVNAAFWSDGADKERWIALPDAAKIEVQTNGDWTLPAGAVLVKNFRLADRLIETRLLMHHPDDTWGGFTYEWNAQQTDATLLSGGATRDLGNGQQWLFPSEAQCLECHTSVAGRTLGLKTAQLNRTQLYPQTGRTANQLDTLSAIAMLNPPIADSSAQPELSDPTDTTAPLDERARAYLDANCSHCHQPSGPTPSTMDLRFATSLAATNTCDTKPQSGDLGLGTDARLIRPGDADHSIVIERMNRRDGYAMPPLGSLQVDIDGVTLIRNWVDSLSSC